MGRVTTVIVMMMMMMMAAMVASQSTCPVVQTGVVTSSAEQKCKCGIKIDGHIYIYCARKQLTRVPKFTRSSILYDELILTGNRIESVAANAFAGLKVKRLLIDDNPIERIDAHAFAELANYLEELVLSGGGGGPQQQQQQQQRTRLASSLLFSSLLNLKQLRLSTLLVDDEQTLRASLFNRTRKLESIALVDCALARLERGALSGVEASLRELNLDNNLIDSAGDVFGEVRRLKRLQVLNLSRNRIRHMFEYSDSSSFIATAAAAIDSGSATSIEPLDVDLSFNGTLRIPKN